jgi:serine/threonine protein kinase
VAGQTTEEDLARETQVLSALDHPNIIRMLELVQDSKRLYVVMEYVEGGPILTRLKDMKHCSEKEAAKVMA